MTTFALIPDASTDLDRRERRRRATLTEILEVSLQVMGEEGVGGLSLAEVARRMGVAPPSLYKHVESKHAVYDALFAAGVRAYVAAVEAEIEGREPSLDMLAAGFEAGVRWCIENPTLTQLMFWRPVPGFEPSSESFTQSQNATARLDEVLAAVVDRGELRPEARSAAGVALFTCLISGVITQQLANEPGVAFEDGRFTRHTREAFALFVDHFGTGRRRRKR